MVELYSLNTFQSLFNFTKAQLQNTKELMKQIPETAYTTACTTAMIVKTAWSNLQSFFDFPVISFENKKVEKIFSRGIRNPWRFWRSYDELVEIEKPKASKLIYKLPLESSSGVVITQGPLNNGERIRTHGYYSCLYAIDFTSLYNQPAGKAIAARGGIVSNVNDMGRQNGALENGDDPRGDGFGNWVAIQHESGETSFYAHLNEVKVKIGDEVKVGQEIGIEGSSGQAGARHLHFSVHRAKNSKSTLHPPYWHDFYETIPYKLEFINEKGSLQSTDISQFAGIDVGVNDKSNPKFFRSFWSSK